MPILGYEVDPVSGTVEPLAGTMESSQGDGTVAIMIGEQAYDHASGQLAPVSGVRRNPETGVVVPVLQDASAGSKRKHRVPKSVVSAEWTQPQAILAHNYISCILLLVQAVGTRCTFICTWGRVARSTLSVFPSRSEVCIDSLSIPAACCF